MGTLLAAVSLFALAIAAPATAAVQSADPHADHAAAASVAGVAASLTANRDERLPAGEEQALEALNHSPRHGEYVDIAAPDGTPLRTWVVYPERRDKAGVVVIVHEIFGLSDWIRSLADQVARDGFIAVAPDLVSGLGPGGGGTDSTHSRDEVVALVRSLSPERAQARIGAVVAWAGRQPAANGRVATLGFCWGGGQSFAAAALLSQLSAAVVYYGVSPDSALLPRVKAPVLGLYGGDDARVNATIPAAKQTLNVLHRFYEPHEFAGAGHGFLRQQSGRDGANLRATEQAWPRTVAFLRKHLK